MCCKHFVPLLQRVSLSRHQCGVQGGGNPCLQQQSPGSQRAAPLTLRPWEGACSSSGDVCKGLLVLHSTDLGAIRQTMRQRDWEPSGMSCSLGWQHLCHEQSLVQDWARDMRSLCLSSIPSSTLQASLTLGWPCLLLCHGTG